MTEAVQDIFLTPLKPPTKTSISAEAIQSCLYYFHVIIPEDEVVKESLEERSRSLATEQGRTSDAIHRKPLPSTSITDVSMRELVAIYIYTYIITQ